MSPPSFYCGGIQTNVPVIGKCIPCQTKFAQGGVVITFHIIMIKAEREVALPEIRLQPKRLERFGMRLLLPWLDRFAEMVQVTCTGGEPRLSGGELSCQAHCLFVKHYRRPISLEK